MPIKSFYLELLAIEFLDQCAWRNEDYFYYDWISRDFFMWMITNANTHLKALDLDVSLKAMSDSAHRFEILRDRFRQV